jgi:hypothetical protein
MNSANTLGNPQMPTQYGLRFEDFHRIQRSGEKR